MDVAVTRGGKTVAGLTADNFVVTDNGVIQNVTAALLCGRAAALDDGARCQQERLGLAPDQPRSRPAARMVKALGPRIRPR